MAKLCRKVGVTSQILQVFIQDSSSASGAGLTGLVYNSSGLAAYYHRDTDTTATSISLVTMTLGTYTSGGFKEIDATNMPGWYQFCPPNAAFASGAANVGVHLKGATNMSPLPLEVDLDAQVDVSLWNGTAVATPATAGVPKVAIEAAGDLAQAAADKVWSTTSRTLSAFGFSVTVGTNNDKTGYGLSAAAVQAVWDAATSALTTAGSIGKLLVDKIDTVLSTLATASSTTASSIRAALGLASANLDTQIAALPSASAVRVEMDANSTKLANLDAAISTRATPAQVLTQVQTANTTAVAESYAANGQNATPAQLLYMIYAMLANKDISSTTLTARKVDGTTAAMTFTLDSATSPTSVTRAS